MNYIKGKIKKIIYHNLENGYMVALFRIKETNVLMLKDKVNKSITVTGIFGESNIDINMILYGDYIKNEKFGMQFNVSNYEIEIPTTKDAILEFLASSFVSGCGEATAKKIVDCFGDQAIEVIKNDKDALLQIEGMTKARALKIYDSLQNYNKSSETILKLQNLGFSVDECFRIFNKFKDKIDELLVNDFYKLKEVIDFNKLDSIYVNNYGDKTKMRIEACFLEAMQNISDSNGDTFCYVEEINKMLLKNFNIELGEDVFLEVLANLMDEGEVINEERRYYLKKYYEEEMNIAKTLKKIASFKTKEIKNIDEKLEKLEKELNINYNETQEKAIKSALNNNITIISGGPGTGKTTIINAIVKLYIKDNLLGNQDIMENIALLAPTGRASKKLASSTGLNAYTIHRYLKWYKDSNDFFYNEFNKTKHRLIIVDEVSMIDIDLFNALLKGISPNIKLILVGDTFQLPSVGPGLVLNDLINSDYFNYVPLNQIYRQSEDSYIPFLAKEIKNNDLSEEFLTKRDDYSFFNVTNEQIKSAILQIIDISRKKKIDD